MFILYYPKDRISEFEVQSDLYQQLKQLGFNVRGEVKAKFSRLHIVVFNNNNIAKCIIEVKSRKRERAAPRKYKRVQKYEELFRLPVITCINRTQINDTINQVKGIINAKSCNN